MSQPQPSHDRPRIICQMRIKNEARWIREVLDSIAKVAQGIVILDDGSTDETPALCKAHPAVLEYRWQNEPQLDEVRDKNWLLKMALSKDPDWILCMDGDEILEDSAPERIWEAIRTCPADVAVLDIEFLYMWNDLHHYRVDGIYGRLFHHRLFSLEGQNRQALSFKPTAHGGNFHCESVPPNILGRSMEIDVKVKHLGYMYPEDRERKYHWYKGHDPAHAVQGYYEHLLDQPGMQIVIWEERPFAASTSKQELKPDYYYANARRNVADKVPRTARRVLDVGCGQGLTGGLLRAERGIEVVGMEIHEDVAVMARRHLDRVVVGDLETMQLPFEPGYFDCIIVADVLEHLVDPWAALEKLLVHLAPEGTVVASIPNIRNLDALGKVVAGSFDYAEQGILDRTHLRFFALGDMHKLFERVGLRAQVAEVVRDPIFASVDLRSFTKPTNLEFGRLVIRDATPAEIEEFTTIQYIFTATRIAVPQVLKPAAPVASVVIPVFNNYAYTKACIESLFKVGEKTPFEVIVVDDASTDGTAEQVALLPYPVKVVRHPENRGFAISCNDGAKAATGRYVVFLNNDTLVLPGWLDAAVARLQGDPTVGLVGNLQIFPDTQKVQQAGIVCGPNKMVYSIYNNDLPADHPAVNKPREFQLIAGSCMFLELAFFRELGSFDEAYLNSCEDVDLCMKVRQAGRKVFYEPKSRIYHFESKTVSGHSKTSSNYKRFLQRWGDALVQDDQRILEEDGFRAATVDLGSLQEVVLIAPPRNFKEPQVSGYSGFSKNLGLGYLAAVLRDKGVKVSVLDAFAEGIDRFVPVDRDVSDQGGPPGRAEQAGVSPKAPPAASSPLDPRTKGGPSPHLVPPGRVYICGLPVEEILARIPATARWVGFNVPFSNVAEIVFELVQVLKARRPELQVVLGGVHPSTFPEACMAQPGVDFVIAGEGEHALASLVMGEAREGIPGLWWKGPDGALRQPQKAARIMDLNALPFPAWDLLPMERYFSVSPRGDRQHRALSLITSRGCPYDCTFCSVHPIVGRNWRARSPENVLAEVAAAVQRYGINHLEIEDDNFTLDRARALAILRGLPQVAPGLTWAAHNGIRVDTLDDELLGAIRDSGCRQLNLAIEHGSEAVLKVMNKKLSLQKVEQVVAACGRMGIACVGFCIVGHPGESAEAFRESYHCFQRLRLMGLTAIAPFIVNAYPGTELHRRAREQGWLHPGTDQQLFFIEDAFVSVTTPDFDRETVLWRLRAMEELSANPHRPFVPEPYRPVTFRPQLEAAPQAAPRYASLLWLRTRDAGSDLVGLRTLAILAEANPGMEMTAVVPSSTAELYEACPHLNHVIGFEPTRARSSREYFNTLVERIHRLGPQVVLHSGEVGDPLARRLLAACQAPMRVGFAAQEDPGNLTHPVEVEGPLQLEQDRHGALLAMLGYPGKVPDPMLWLLPEDEAFVEGFLVKQGLDPARIVLVAPEAESELQLFPGWGQALRGFCARHRLTPVVVGGASSEPVFQVLRDFGPGAVNAAGLFGLRQTAALLKRCRLAVGPEARWVHMATHFKVPHVVALGGGTFGRHVPYAPTTTAAALPLACYGCTWDCPFTTPHCLTALAPKVVEEALEQTLARSAPTPRLVLQTGWTPGPGAPQGLDLEGALEPDRVQVLKVKGF